MSTESSTSQLSLIKAILRELPVPVIVSDRDARVLFLNASAEKLLQCTQEAVGRVISSVVTLVNSQSGLSINTLVEHVLGDGSVSAAWNADLVTNAGRQIPVELVASPLRLDEDKIAGVTLTLRDRAEEQHIQRQVQQLLEKAESEREWFSLVLNSIADEVYFTDTDRRYTYANPAAMREFGHESVQGIEVAKVIENMVVLRADGSPRPIAEAPPLRALRGEVIRDEEQIVHTPRTGEFRHRRVSAAPVRNRHGRIIGSVSVVRDITEHRRAEAVPRSSSRSVLIVDADADAADTLAMFLRRSGHTVHVARGSAQALELACRVQPQFALLDIDSPEMNGYELAARIRGEPWGVRMMLFAVTVRRRKGDISKAMTAGFNRHFTKPVDPKQLDLLLTSCGRAGAPSEPDQPQ